MEDQEFINQLAEKLSKLGTVRPLGFHYLHPYGTVPADSIICNGATYSRALYKDFFDYITTQGWVKTEAEWQEIATRDNGFCPFYSSGDGSTNFRTPKFAPYQQIAMGVAQATTYHQAGLPNITGRVYDKSGNNSPDWTINPDTTETSGAFRIGADGGYTGAGTSQKNIFAKDFNFDALRSNTIYGASDTVQPECHSWVMCVVAYGVATNVGSVDVSNVMSAVAQVQADVENIQANMPPRSSVYVKEIWKSGTEWRRIFSDGWIEQGGILKGNSGTVSFHKGFSNTDYTFLHTPNLSGMSGQWFAWGVSSKTTTSIKINMVGGANTAPSSMCWVAYGY